MQIADSVHYIDLFSYYKAKVRLPELIKNAIRFMTASLAQFGNVSIFSRKVKGERKFAELSILYESDFLKNHAGLSGPDYNLN